MARQQHFSKYVNRLFTDYLHIWFNIKIIVSTCKYDSISPNRRIRIIRRTKECGLRWRRRGRAYSPQLMTKVGNSISSTREKYMKNFFFSRKGLYTLFEKNQFFFLDSISQIRLRSCLFIVMRSRCRPSY